MIEPRERPVSAVADHNEFRDVVSVTVEEDSPRSMVMLFDPDGNLNERILREQFLV